MKRSLSLPGNRSIELGARPIVMGIVNVTPDSFFGDSRKLDPLEAAEKALAMCAEGADMLDFGAESTRPGSTEVSPDEEIRRLLPALREFRRRSSAIVSVDTRHAATARAALDEGADIINDIGALSDPGMAETVARAKAALVLMHMQGEPGTMQNTPFYRDCAREVKDFLLRKAAYALEAGIPGDMVILDPGIGFGKLLEHNLDLLRRLHLLADCGYPVLVGLSRKRFVGEITGKPIEGRMPGSLGAACAAWRTGADIFRVHDVGPTRDALDVYAASCGELWER
jgi:dihydropteroate synthase